MPTIMVCKLVTTTAYIYIYIPSYMCICIVGMTALSQNNVLATNTCQRCVFVCVGGCFYHWVCQCVLVGLDMQRGCV